ncbi:MAG: DUF3169 family protein [Lachnospiraceae bacterium]|nr:DUF3169 family protein [Lachnospiraceae bacterium]
MNEKKRLDEIKKEDSKNKPIFFIILVLLMFLGGVCGFLVSYKDQWLISAFNFLGTYSQIGSIISTVCLFLASAISITVGWIIYAGAKKMWKDEASRDDNWEKIERKLSIASIVNSAGLIVSFFFYGCAVYDVRDNISTTIPGAEFIKVIYGISFICAIVLVMFFAFLSFYQLKKIVELEKIMNPEKKGSLYDFGFKKKWYKSFDEAEMRQAGIAAYKALLIVNLTCMITFVVLIFIGMVVKITVFPHLAVSVIWVTQNIAFGVESIKSNKIQ